MAQKNAAALTTENAAVITGQTTPESITPATDGAFRQDMIDSFWNKLDDPFTLPPITYTRAQLNLAIALSGLSDQQQITITDRIDSKPLIVFARGNNNISPNGIWINAGKPLKVVMDYVNGFEGETKPFVAVYDGTGNLNLNSQIVIADSSKGANKVLVSDPNGKGTWTDFILDSYQSPIRNPGGTTGTQIMLGLAGSITPKKTGKYLIIVSGEYKSANLATATNMNVTVGTGTAPANGDPATTGSAFQHNERLAITSTDKYSVSFNWIVMNLTVGTTYWIDLSINNNANSATQMYNISVSAQEQL